jgi:hypothetical protein
MDGVKNLTESWQKKTGTSRVNDRSLLERVELLQAGESSKNSSRPKRSASSNRSDPLNGSSIQCSKCCSPIIVFPAPQVITSLSQGLLAVGNRNGECVERHCDHHVKTNRAHELDHCLLSQHGHAPFVAFLG